nr:isoform 2 of cysteine-rich receptor-like protein kinase 10 [Quercus suber]
MPFCYAHLQYFSDYAGKRQSSSVRIIAIVTSIAVSVVLLTMVYCFSRRKLKKKYKEDAAKEITAEECLIFDLATLKAATNNFSDENELGKGGFGVVYKGTFLGGQEIAVKRLSSSSKQEYAIHGLYSMKSDVYSFGVLILEIISGKKNSSFSSPSTSENLLSYAWKHWRDGTFLELLDLTLRDSYSRDEVKRCLHIGLQCIQESSAERPTMASIVLMLNSYSLSLSSPQRPAFFLHSGTETSMPIKELRSDQSTSNGIPSSVNESKITEVYPR